MRFVTRLLAVVVVAAAAVAVGATSASASSGPGFTLDSRWYYPNACVDMDINGPLDGAAVQLWHCNGTRQQGWYLGADFGGGWREIRSRYNDRCLDVNIAKGTGNATPVQMWGCNGWQNQQWSLEWTSANSVRLHSRLHGCLDINWNGGWWDGKTLQIWDCHSYDNQVWNHNVRQY